MFGEGEKFREGAKPPLLLYPLSSQEKLGQLQSGTGWRGVRGEAKLSTKCKQNPFFLAISGKML